jgi:hypothetical protein
VALRFSSIAWAACEGPHTNTDTHHLSLSLSSSPTTAYTLFALLLFSCLLLAKLASGIVLTQWAARVELSERERRERRRERERERERGHGQAAVVSCS